MWLRLALVATLATPVLHTVVLLNSRLDAVRDPISALSSQPWGTLHTLGLLLFGLAHLALTLALGGQDRGRLWPYGRALLAISGVALFAVAYYFASATADVLAGPDANDPLWIVASLIGLAMGALQPGLARRSRELGLFTVACLGIWLWLVLLAYFVTPGWLGLYERMVGAVYVAWIAGVAAGLIILRRSEAQQA
ncbi:MAG: DUF998 domain-containing protein [Pseudomonadota bacterium]